MWWCLPRQLFVREILSRQVSRTSKSRVNELRASDNEVYRPAGHDERGVALAGGTPTIESTRSL